MNKFTKKALIFLVLLLISITSIPGQTSAFFDLPYTSRMSSPYSSLFLSSQPSITPSERFDFPLFTRSSVMQLAVAANEDKSGKSAVRTAIRTGVPAKKTYVVSATAYSSTPDQTDDSPFITAMGTHVRDGIIATNMLPFGSRVRIPSVFGDKIFVVEDRMNKRYWDRIDVWFPDRESAYEFGLKRSLIIEVL